MRVEGKFVDADGNRPEGQYVSFIHRCFFSCDGSNRVSLQVLLYLLRRCYGLIYRLLSSSEPVSEELMPIVRSCSSPCLTIITAHACDA